MGAGASSILVYSSQNKKLNNNLSTVQDCDQFTPEELASPLFDQSSFKNLKNLYVYGAYTNQSQEFSTELVKVPKTLTVDDWCSNVITGNGNSFLPFGIEAVESNLFTLAFIVFGLAAIPYFNKHNNFLWFMNLWYLRVALIIVACFMLQRSANPETKYSWDDIVNNNLSISPEVLSRFTFFGKK